MHDRKTKCNISPQIQERKPRSGQPRSVGGYPTFSGGTDYFVDFVGHTEGNFPGTNCYSLKGTHIIPKISTTYILNSLHNKFLL